MTFWEWPVDDSKKRLLEVYLFYIVFEFDTGPWDCLFTAFLFGKELCWGLSSQNNNYKTCTMNKNFSTFSLSKELHNENRESFQMHIYILSHFVKLNYFSVSNLTIYTPSTAIAKKRVKSPIYLLTNLQLMIKTCRVSYLWIYLCGGLHEQLSEENFPDNPDIFFPHRCLRGAPYRAVPIMCIYWE